MGTSINHLEAKPTEMVLDLRILVVAGSVQKQYRLLPEVGPVSLEFQRQLCQIQPHDVGIRIDLCEGQIGVALRVHGGYH